jgi:hypothetical protein
VAKTQQRKEYWGLAAIGRRMGWRDKRRAIRLAVIAGFPLYIKKKDGGAREWYYASEQSIRAWEWNRCANELDRLLADVPLAAEEEAMQGC